MKQVTDLITDPREEYPATAFRLTSNGISRPNVTNGGCDYDAAYGANLDYTLDLDLMRMA